MNNNIKNSSNLTSASQKRTQNKKRKLEAFFKIALLNDTQRLANRKKQESSEPVSKKRKKSSERNSLRPYKKEIAEMMAANKKALGESEEKKSELSGHELVKLKVALRQRKKLLKSSPRFWIRQLGLKATLERPLEDRVPLFVGDVQHLVLFALLGNSINQDHNRWCHLERHGLVSQVVVLLLEGIGVGDLLKPLKKKDTTDDTLARLFPDRVEIVNPETYDRSLADDFSLVPLSARKCRSMLLKFGSKEAELQSRVFRVAFPIGVAIDRSLKTVPETQENGVDSESAEKDTKLKSSKAEEEEAGSDKLVKEDSDHDVSKEQKQQETEEDKEKMEEGKVKAKIVNGVTCHPEDKFPRTELLLSPSQMIEEGYAVPIGEMAYRYQDYVYTKQKYAAVTPLSPMFGLDCEMCMTTARKNELTRISVVDENHQAVYETLVMPHNRITNYLTQYSGITHKMMIGVKTRLKNVQADLQRILPPDAILVGQSLNCDLHAIKMFHPYVIDSSVVFNIWGQRRKKTKLKTLTEMFLGEKIQQGVDGHDSIEDSIAALKLVQFKLSKSLDFGDTVIGFDLKKAQVSMTGQPRKKAKTPKEEPEEEEVEEDYKHVPIALPQPEVLKVMEASSLFKLAARSKKVGVFAKPEVLSQYTKYLSGHHHLAGSELSLRVGSHGFSADTNYKVVKLLLKEAAKFNLAVGHLKLDLTGEYGKERARAVNTCVKVAEMLQDNGMLIVVAGGRPKDVTDGRPDHRPACMVHLKQPVFTKL